MKLPARPSSQHGRGNLGCLTALLVLAGLGYLGYKFLPHYIDNFRLKDAAKEIAVYRAARGVSAQGVKGIVDEVLAKGKEFGIRLKREDVQVRQEEEKVSITVRYKVPIELATGVYELQFDFTAEN